MPTDARGVDIDPGDTAIWGFDDGGSVAMAEGVVLGERDSAVGPIPTEQASPRVSLTPSGRVRVRVIRRSGYGGSKPVIDIAPDRLVVLKSPGSVAMRDLPVLPPSPLPTQDEANRQRIENLIEKYTADLRATEVPDQYYWEGKEGKTLAEFHAYTNRRLAELREELKKLP